MSTGDRAHVLVIDDDPVAVEGMRQLLGGLGYDVTIATSGTEGLLSALPGSVSVVLCDLGLPDVDGFEIALRLRRDPRTRHVRLVAVTGYRRMADDTARAAGFDAYLVKPVEIEALLAALEGRGGG
ncbi:MAG: response regulator [Myxococcota bacterium]